MGLTTSPRMPSAPLCEVQHQLPLNLMLVHFRPHLCSGYTDQYNRNRKTKNPSSWARCEILREYAPVSHCCLRSAVLRRKTQFSNCYYQCLQSIIYGFYKIKNVGRRHCVLSIVLRRLALVPTFFAISRHVEWAGPSRNVPIMSGMKFWQFSFFLNPP